MVRMGIAEMIDVVPSRRSGRKTGTKPKKWEKNWYQAEEVGEKLVASRRSGRKTGTKKRSGRKTCTSATSPTTNPIRNFLVLNTGLVFNRPWTNRPLGLTLST